MPNKQKVNLANFQPTTFQHGQPLPVRLAWFFANAIFFQAPWNPFMGIKRCLLRLFGAKLGKKVIIKPAVNIKHPWRLTIGDHTWIGEGTWIDNMDPITIGSHCCISQGAYLCTGNHDWTDPRFDITAKPIIIENGVWIGAHAIVLPGVTMANHSVVTAGSVLAQSTQPYMIYQGNPAQPVKKRNIRQTQ